MARRFQVRFRVYLEGFAKSRALAPGLIEAAQPLVTTALVVRTEAPAAFVPPELATSDDPDDDLRLPTAASDALGEMRAFVERAGLCWEVGSTAESEDLMPLQAAMGLVAALLDAYEGTPAVVVDATSGLGYFADELQLMAEELRDSGRHAVRDAVAVVATRQGNEVLLTTRGMSKYGQQDFRLACAEDDELMLRHYLYDNVSGYAAMRSVIVDGQTLQYQRSDPRAQVFFGTDPEDAGILRVTDCAVGVKRAGVGLERLLSVFRPVWQARFPESPAAEEPGVSAPEAEVTVEDEPMREDAAGEGVASPLTPFLALAEAVDDAATPVPVTLAPETAGAAADSAGQPSVTPGDRVADGETPLPAASGNKEADGATPLPAARADADDEGVLPPGAVLPAPADAVAGGTVPPLPVALLPTPADPVFEATVPPLPIALLRAPADPAAEATVPRLPIALLPSPSAAVAEGATPVTLPPSEPVAAGTPATPAPADATTEREPPAPAVLIPPPPPPRVKAVG